MKTCTNKDFYFLRPPCFSLDELNPEPDGGDNEGDGDDSDDGDCADNKGGADDEGDGDNKESDYPLRLKGMH